MAGISFAEGADCVWIVSGWAFRQVLEDLRLSTAGDRSILEEIDNAGHLGFLHVDFLPEPLRVKMSAAIEHLCWGILGGSIRSGVEQAFSDIETRQAYLEGIQSLLAAVQAAKPPEPA